MPRLIPIVLFLLLVVVGGSLIGAANTPGAWYAGLAKPPFNPPDWIFAPVWTVLYVMIALAGWRVWRLGQSGGAMSVWWMQLGLNFLWSPVFFTLQSPLAALVVILGLLASIMTFIRLTWDLDRTAALLFLPYAAWVSFAVLLNAAIVALN